MAAAAAEAAVAAEAALALAAAAAELAAELPAEAAARRGELAAGARADPLTNAGPYGRVRQKRPRPIHVLFAALPARVAKPLLNS